MLDVLREIDGKRKERTYFHQIPTEEDLEDTVKAVGMVLGRKSQSILHGIELDDETKKVYEKIITIYKYQPENMFFSTKDQNIIVAKSFKDERFKKVMSFIREEGNFEDERELEDVLNKLQEMEDELGIEDGVQVTELTDKELILLDDGIDGIECIADKDIEMEEGKVYEVELSKNIYKGDAYLVIGGEESYVLDKATEI